MTSRRLVRKLIGGDLELGNFILGSSLHSQKTDHAASRLVLAEVSGYPVVDRERHGVAVAGATDFSYYGNGSYSQDRDRDWGRKYLATNGGCIYIDLNHTELATPEVLNARDFQAAWMAMLRITRAAQVAANARLENAERIVVLANNSDRQSSSYGGHQSFLMSREAFDEMLAQRMLPSLFYLMAYQASSIVFTGQGKVGSENGAPGVDYQISQRADFIETLIGEQTTFRRPIVNTRDEPLCGLGSYRGDQTLPGDRLARLHVIFYDTTLAPVSTYLKVGVMQLILTMIEAGQADANLVLVDPLGALHEWSHDPQLDARARIVSGQELTAVELQLRFFEQASAFVESGACDGVVPDAEIILALWEDTLLKLHARDFASLSPRLDWVAKRALLEHALAREPDLSWRSPEIVRLDQIYSSLDPDEGLFWQLNAAGLVQAVASEEEIARYVTEPPEDTRAWLRAMLLRAAGPEQVIGVDWDHIKLRGVGDYRRAVKIELADPLSFTKAEAHRCFGENQELDSLLDALQSAGVISPPGELTGSTSLYGSILAYPQPQSH